MFIKYRNSEDVWRHALLSTGGAQPGSGTPAMVQVTSDLVGAFVYRSEISEGTFGVTTMQLRWNYGIHGITNPEDLEVRVFALEMVYVPEGKFAMRRITEKPYSNHFRKSVYDFFCVNSGAYPIISERWTPKIEVRYFYGADSNTNPTNIIDSFRINGISGIDYNSDGDIDNSNFPLGFKPFYIMKYEATIDVYAALLNTLNTQQLSSLGIICNNISLNSETYYSSTPNLACVTDNNKNRTLAFGDWLGLRPMSIFEYSKASFGPLPPSNYAWGTNHIVVARSISGEQTGLETANPSDANVLRNFYIGNAEPEVLRAGIFARQNTTRVQSGSSYYGVMELTGNVNEPVIIFNCEDFDSSHGNGELNPSNGFTTQQSWKTNKIIHVGAFNTWETFHGFRYVRSAE